MAADRKKHDNAAVNGGGNSESNVPSNDSEMSLAASAKISEEEQREIFNQINGIAEKNRRSLSTDPTKSFKAKKNGGLFPVLTNVFAAVMLAGGFFALYAFQSEAEVQAREGTRIFNPAERALIEEIRRETVASLAERDREISMILYSLADAETQLQELSANGDTLTPEQMVDRERIRAQREERRAALALAREERSLILEEARADEVDLQVRRDARAQERITRTAGEDAERQARREERRSERAAQVAEADAERAGTRSRRTGEGTAEAHTELAVNRTERGEPRGRGRAAEEERRAAEAREAEEAELLALREARRAARAARAESGEPRDSERGRNRERDAAEDSDAARSELAAARRERRRAEAEEGQLTGLAVRTGRRVADAENLYEAEEAIDLLRYVLETPVFQGRNGRARMDIAQVADTLEVVVREERRGGAARQRMAELDEQVGALQEILGMGRNVPSEDLLDRVQFLTNLLDDSEIRQAVQERLRIGQ